jgi:hypothetical protein
MIARSQMGKTKELFRCKEITKETHMMMYLTIPMSTLPWGCESRASKEEEKRMLESLHHRAIRRILGTTMQRERHEKIANLHVRQLCLKIPKITNFVKRGVLNTEAH